MNVAVGNCGQKPYLSVFAIGFGVSVVMWALLYVCLMPGVGMPGDVVVGLMGVMLVLGGVLYGKFTSGGLKGAGGVGVVNWGVNLLILSSMMERDPAGRWSANGLQWIGGYLVLGVVLSCVGWGIGRWMRGDGEVKTQNWLGWFGIVSACTTGILIVAGGVVTGLEAGLAVPDWPNTFGHPMIFYPLSLMQNDGGVYAEHTHRLFGMLVGLTSLTLLVLIYFNDLRKSVRVLMTVTFLLVCAQGVLGGLRVTATSTAMAAMHGVSGQLIFVLMTLVACMLSTRWLNTEVKPLMHASARLDHKLSAILKGLLILQLIFGAGVRHPGYGAAHFNMVLMVHITMAAVIVCLAFVVGSRTLGMYKDEVVLKRLGILVLVSVVLQAGLGIFSMVVVIQGGDKAGVALSDVIVTTMHQANGALLLAGSAMLWLFMRRLVVPGVGEVEGGGEGGGEVVSVGG